MMVGRTPQRRRRTRRKNTVISFFPWRAEPVTIAPEAKPELADTGMEGQSSRESKEKRRLLSKGVCRGTVPLLHYPLTSLSGGNETALVCKPSPGSGARLCAINKSKCQRPRPASKASLPKEPGVETARARQHGQWSPRSHSRESNHPHPPQAHL